MDLRHRGAAQPLPRADRPRLARAAVARRLHVGAAVDRRDRQLGHLRALHGPLHRRRAEDPHVALRRGACRRRRPGARVLRRDAAGAPGRDPRRLRADDDQRAPQLRHHLQHDGRRAREVDARPLDVHVPERVSVQPRRATRRRSRRCWRSRSSCSRRSCCASATGASTSDGRPHRPAGHVLHPLHVLPARALPGALDPVSRAASRRPTSSAGSRSRRGSTSRASRPRGPRATSRPASSRASSSRAP